MNSNPQCLFKVFSGSLINSDGHPFFSAKTTTTTMNMKSCLFTALVNTNKSKLQLHVLNNKNKNLPLLIVPYDDDQKNGGNGVCDDTLGFISFFDDVKKSVHKLYLPEIADRRICGSSEGWLVTVHENTQVQLLNPITRVLVHLPPLNTSFPEVVAKLVLEKENYKGICYLVIEDMSAFFEQNDSSSSSHFFRGSSSSDHRSFDGYDSHFFRGNFFKKVITSTTTIDANNNNNSTLPAVVMAIYGEAHRLAFCRPSDEQKRWICCLRGDQGIYEDVTFYKGSFYAVGALGNVVVVKGIDGPSPIVETIIEREKGYHSDMNYLVESSSSSSGGDGDGGGDLLKVMRTVETKYKEEGCPYRTTGFRVMKLDFNGGGPPSLVEVTNLGEDCALFIGFNHSFSFSASKIPGCRGNCIYFTDDRMLVGKGHDMGVYNLEDDSIEKLYETTSSSQIFIPPGVWYVPN